MNLDGKIILEAEPAKVWKLLLDMDQVAACIPGLQGVSQVDDRTFDGIIEATVGPLSGKFSFRAHILESDSPRELVAQVEGTDSITKSRVTAETTVTLSQCNAVETELSYRSSVNVKGRLAILGEMVMRASAVAMMEEIAQRLRSQVTKSSTLV
ncbi:MAG: hypothetical protein GEU75_09610 [Dehalococcoidia bacterium]|nr:hypothetical protein [Dehalococcoidia bacterium]